MDDVTNADRANWAYHSMMHFAEQTGLVASGDSEDLDLVVRDFLCDLMHLCDAQKLDLAELLLEAEGNYEDEKAEEAEDQDNES